MTASGIANHLWQSTACLAVAALLVRFVCARSAAWRFRVWFAASIKFLVPFSLLIAAGAQVPLRPDLTAPTPRIAVAVEVLGAPFTSMRPSGTSAPEASTAVRATQTPLMPWLVIVWAGVGLGLAAIRLVRSRRLARLVRAASPVPPGREMTAFERAAAVVDLRRPVRVRASTTLLEPALVGVFRPAVLWPTHLSGHVGDRELEAIFTHELLHAKRRDNLAALVHSVVETIFWFHPLAHWLGFRLGEERERACDEAVIHAGHEPEIYARGILKVCDFCLSFRPAPVSGIASGNLTRRLEEIMNAHAVPTLTAARKMLLSGVLVAAAAIPLAVGSVYAMSPAALPDAPPAALQPAFTPPPSASTDAQTSTSTARVWGTIVDQRSAPIAGATIHVTPSGFTGETSTTSDERGGYSLQLPPAQYELRVEKPGFQPARATIFLSRGADIQRDVELRLGARNESINVAPPSAPANSQTPADNLEQARLLYQQGRVAEAEQQARLALSRLHSETIAAARPAAAAAGSAPASTAASATLSSGAVRVGGDIKEPRKIFNVDPVYPPVALAAQVQGIVIIEALIGTDGTVQDAKVLRGQPLLNQAALDAVTQWQFTPTTLNGAPVEVLMTVTINFRL